MTKSKESYTLVINGYDWGPAVDKIIVNCGKFVSSNNLNIQDFSVSTEIEGYDWSAFPPKLKNMTGEREITSVYLCDESGNPSVTSESEYIALEMAVHPENPFCNPFLYGSDMMNHWQKVYDVVISNKNLKLLVSTERKRISPLADQFKMGVFTASGITLNYASWEPENHGEKVPLIIWLHGMGEGGKDPYITLLGNKVVNLITPVVQNCFGSSGAFVLAPQADGFWMQTDLNSREFNTWVGDNNPVSYSAYTKTLFSLIDDFVQKNPCIDKNRIYIGGCSNGGYMTMNMLIEYPDYFAAAYPVCQAYPDSKIDDKKLEILARQHIWFTQSDDDKTVNPEAYTKPTYKRLLEKGAADVHLSLWEHVQDCTGMYKDKKGEPYLYNGHFSWIYTLNNECTQNGISIFQWMSGRIK